MSDHDHVPAEEESRNDEYAELWRRIVTGGWHPGDIFRTSKGAMWKFRETPYTSDFPEVQERHASGQTSADRGLRW